MVIKFRSEKSQLEYYDLLEEHSRSWTDQETQYLSNKYTDSLERCPVCCDADLTMYLEKPPLRFEICSLCKSIVQSPIIKNDAIEEGLYRGSMASNVGESFRLETAGSRLEHKFVPLLKKYQKFLNSGRLLDIGCSNGSFIKLVRSKTSMDVVGLDLNKNIVEKLREEGYLVYDRDIRKLNDLEESFDTIVCWGTIMHIPYPIQFLKQCWRALKYGGVLLMHTPNVGGFEYSLGVYHDTFHITLANIFSNKGMSICLEKAGFKNIEIENVGNYDVEIVREVLLRKTEARSSYSRFLLNRLIGNEASDEEFRIAFQKLLTDQQLTGDMEAVAVKT